MSAHEQGAWSGGSARGRGDVEDLLDRHLDLVSAYVRRRVSNTSDCEEIVADVFVKAWRAAASRPSDPEQETAWLMSIARNRVIDQYRRASAHGRMRRRLRWRGVDTAVPPPPLPDDGTLTTALQRLPADDRELLRLVAWEQLPHRDIAMILGCTTANVSVRLHRARARLRALLNEIDVSQVTPSDVLGGEGATR